MTRVLEYSPSKKIVALYFVVAIVAGLFSPFISYVFISIILIWFICKRIFSTYLNRKEQVTNDLEKSVELLRGTPEERMEAILRDKANDSKK